MIRPLPAACLLAAALAAVAARADDRRADALFETALSSYQLERFEDSANKFYDFMAAAPHDPRNDEAQYYVARCFNHRRYLNKAIEEYTYLIDDFPDSVFTTLGLHERAHTRLETRDIEAAVADMERVIARPVRIYHGEEDPLLKQLYENHRADVFWLADHYLKLNEHERAMAAYRRLPYVMEGFRHVVNVLYGLGHTDRIRELIDALEGENRHEGFKYMMEFYARQKAVNQLKDMFGKLLEEKDPTRATDDLVRHTGAQFIHLSREDWEWALGRISTHYPRMARWADHELARFRHQDPGYLDAMELFVIKYRNGADVDEVLRWKGLIQERQGRAEEARRDYRRMGEAGLGHWYAAEAFHGAHAREKDLKGAINEYAELRKAFYSMEWAAMAQWRVADLHRELREADAAVEAYRQIVSRFGALVIEGGPMGLHQERLLQRKTWAYGPEAQLAAGDTLREAGRYDDAEMEYRAAVVHFPRTEQGAHAAYRIALCHEGLGDTETAIRIMKSVLRRFPRSAAASEAHTRLEVQYKIDDEYITDAVDFFSELETDAGRKTFLEAPEKMRDFRRPR